MHCICMFINSLLQPRKVNLNKLKYKISPASLFRICVRVGTVRVGTIRVGTIRVGTVREFHCGWVLLVGTAGYCWATLSNPGHCWTHLC